MKKFKNDLMLLLAFAALAGLVWLCVYITRSGGAYARVTVGGAAYGVYSLDTDAEIRIGNDEQYNILFIEDGMAAVSEASCPDKLCVHEGNISFSGQSIICLPNKLVVEIVDAEQSSFDAVAK